MGGRLESLGQPGLKRFITLTDPGTVTYLADYFLRRNENPEGYMDRASMGTLFRNDPDLAAFVESAPEGSSTIVMCPRNRFEMECRPDELHEERPQAGSDENNQYIVLSLSVRNNAIIIQECPHPDPKESLALDDDLSRTVVIDVTKVFPELAQVPAPSAVPAQASAPKKQFQTTSRREFLDQAGTVIIASSLTLAAIIGINVISVGSSGTKGSDEPSPRSPEPDEPPRKDEPSPKESPRPQATATGPEQRVEKVPGSSSFATVLEAALIEKVEKTKTYRDQPISPFALSKQLLGDKFWYTGAERVNYAGSYYGEMGYHFALLGSDSGCLGFKGRAKNRHKSTELSDAINELLDYENLSDEQIIGWIVFTYLHSFGVLLDPQLLSLTRRKGDGKYGKVKKVTYNAPDSFEEHIVVNVPETMGGFAAEEGKRTKDRQYRKILGINDKLFLPSGISPTHDLIVPESLLPNKKPFRLDLPGNGGWDLTVADLAAAIKEQRKVEGKNKSIADLVLPERDGSGAYSSERLIPYAMGKDPYVKELAKFITEGARNKEEEYRAITKFVQRIGEYIKENDHNFNRHPLITIFNGGSDCNNFVTTWISLCAARGLDYAVFHVPSGEPRPGEQSCTHVYVGIPEAAFRKVPRGAFVHEGFVGVELTDPHRRIGHITADDQFVSGTEIAHIKEDGTWDLQNKIRLKAN